MEVKVFAFFMLVAVALLGIAISAQNSTTANAVFNATLPFSLVSWTASNGTIGYGGIQVLNANVSGGMAPYTYNFFVYNASGVQEFDAMFNSTNATTYSFAFQQLAVWGPGLFTANVVVLNNVYLYSPATSSLTYVVQSTTTTSSSSSSSAATTSTSSISASTTSSATSSTSTSTSSTSSSSTTSLITLPGNIIGAMTTNIPHGVISVGQNATAALGFTNGSNQARVLVQGNAVKLVSNRSILTKVSVNLNTKNLTIDFSVKNQSTVPASFVKPSLPVWQFIQVNGSMENNPGANIDQYITNATYNFTVPIAWIKSQGTDCQSIRLFKYDSATYTYVVLPTRLISSNASYCAYSALSGSFSTYAVSYTSTSGQGTGTSFSLAASGAYTSNFYVIAGQDQDTNTLQTNTVANVVVDLSQTVQSNSGSARSINTVVIGRNVVGPGVASISYTAGSACGTACGTVIAIASANVIMTSNTVNGNIYKQSGTISAATSQTYNLVYNVGSSNSMVIILYGLSANVFSGAPTTNAVTGSSACTLSPNAVSGTRAAAAIMICTDVISGTGYKASLVSPASAVGHTYAMAAYVFPPYGVSLVDNPTTGNVYTSNMIGGPASYASGQTINVIGTQSINAIAPSGYTFYSWAATTNPSNFIISSASSANTFLTVEGNGVITATYNAYATAGTPKPSNVLLDFGQYVTYNTVLSNGHGPFTVNLMTGTTVVNTMIVQYSASAQTVTFGINVPAVGASDTFNVMAIDTGASPTYSFNSVQNTITVNALPSLSVPIPSNVLLDFGQYVTYNTVLSNGHGPFTVNLMTGTTVVNTIIVYYSSSSQTVTFKANVPAVGATDTFNVVAIDTGTTTPLTFNSVSNVITVSTAYGGNTLTRSNAIVDQGQVEVLTGAVSGGTSAYTYNFMVVNTVTGNVVASRVVTNTVTSNSFTFTMPSTANAFGTLSANLIVTDSATTNMVTVTLNTITVRTGPTVSTPLPSNVILDFGQSVTYNTILTGTGSSFTVNLVMSGVVANTLAGVSAATLTFGANIPAVGSADVFNVAAVDTGTTNPFAFNSLSNTIVVYNAPSVTVPKPSNVLLDFGQYVIYNTVLSNGIGPFTVNLMYGTNVVNVITESAGFSGTVTFAANIPLQATDIFNVLAVDTGTTTPFAFNSASNTIVVSAVPTLSTPTPSNMVLDFGQYVIYNTILSNGQGPFTVNLMYGTNVVNTIIAASASTVTFGANIPAQGTDTFNVMAVDTGASTSYAFNSVSNTITVNSALTSPWIIASNMVNVDVNQYELFYTYWTGGAPTYTVNYILTNSVTGSPLTSHLDSGITSTSDTWSYQIPSAWSGNSIAANVVIGDSATTQVTASAAYMVGTQLGAWSSTTSYPVSMFEAKCSISGGYIYCVGTEGTLTHKNVYYAPISSTGVGTWSSTTDYPVQMVVAGCSINSGYIYCVGTEATTNGNEVYYAPVLNPGLGSWVSTTFYPIGLYSATCNINGGYIYCVGADQTQGENEVYYAPVLSPGIGTWSSTTFYPEWFENGFCSVSRGYIYCVGTEDDAKSLYNEVYYSPISSSGVGTWSSTTSYPVPIKQAGCMINNNYIYCVGTAFTTAMNEVYYAPVLSPGIGSWTSTTFYPVKVQATMGCSTSGNYIYCVGTEGTTAMNEVYYAPISYYSSNIMVNAVPTLSTPTPSNVALDYGQSVTYNVVISGGTGPFTVNLMTGTTVVNTIVASSASTVTFGSNVPAQGTDTFNVMATDNYALVAFNSVSNTITVNAAMSPQISSSPAFPETANVGDAITFTALTGPSRLWAGNGIAAWSSGANYPLSVGASSCTTYGNTIYCVGGGAGSNGATHVNSVYYAPISISGVGTWSSTTNYPLTFAYGACVSPSNTIYCMGGYDSVVYNNVYYAPISTTGIGAWSSTTSYPVNVDTQSCVTYSNTLYCAGGITGVTVFNAVYYASISSTGVGTWSSTTSYPANTYSESCNTYGNTIFCVAGSGGSNVNTVYYAPISTTGIGTWSSTTHYPLSINYHSCAAYNNTVYCVAGGAGNDNAVYYAPISSSGVGTWSSTAAYLTTVFADSCATYGNTIYCMGGLNGRNPVNNFYWAGLPGSTPLPLNGVPPFTYNYYVTNSVDNVFLLIGSYASVSSSSNSFTWTVPGSVASYMLQANVVITDSATTAVTSNIALSNLLTVAGSACFTGIDNSVINFGSISPSISMATDNAVLDTNLAGTANSYMYVLGGNWIITSSQLNGFGISNTSWSTSYGVSYSSANQLSVAAANTGLYVASGGGSNTIYFGLNIPPGAAATSYNQIITIENSC